MADQERAEEAETVIAEAIRARENECAPTDPRALLPHKTAEVVMQAIAEAGLVIVEVAFVESVVEARKALDG